MIIIVPSFETQNPWGISSAGRAPALHAGGQEFESPILQILKRPVSNRSFLLSHKGFQSSMAPKLICLFHIQ